MLRGILVFLIVWFAVVVGIDAWRSLTGKEKWDTIKTVMYGGLTALFAGVVLVGIVILF